MEVWTWLERGVFVGETMGACFVLERPPISSSRGIGLSFPSAWDPIGADDIHVHRCGVRLDFKAASFTLHKLINLSIWISIR